MLQERLLKGNQEVLSGSITQNWTQQAIECYELGFNCEKCSITKGNYSFSCKMPDVIEHLLLVIGEPID